MAGAGRNRKSSYGVRTVNKQTFIPRGRNVNCRGVNKLEQNFLCFGQRRINDRPRCRSAPVRKADG